MVELSQKIRKKIYKFELKKRYQYVRHYRAKERPPVERIKDELRRVFSPKKAEKAISAAANLSSTTSPSGGFNFIVFGAFIFIALILLGIAWLFLSIQPPSVGVFQPMLEKSEISNSLDGGTVLITGDRNSPKYIAAVMANYQTANLKNYTVVLSAYDARIPSEVFLLNTERVDAATYADFVRVLRSNLAKRKIILNEITLKQLESIPQGAIVIMPSGAVPREILGMDSPLTMNKLADRGIVLIYMGQPFTKMLNGTVPNLVSFTPQDVVKSLPVRFDETSPLESSDGFHLFQPLYRALPTGGWYGDMAYGSVSIIKRGDGAFIFVPQTLDGGWRSNYTGAADDISRLIFDIPWAQATNKAKYYTLTNQSNYSGRQYFFSEPFSSPNITVKVDFIGYPPNSNIPVRETLFIRLEKQRDNYLFIEEGGTVVSANITDQPIRMNAQLREPRAAQPNMYISILDMTGAEVQSIARGPVNVQADLPIDVKLYLDRGEYIVRLVDDFSTIYTQTYMKVVSIDITPKGQDQQKKSIYLFDITMDGSPRTVNDLTVKVDNGQYGTYKFTNVDKLRVDVGQYTGGEALPMGKHTFDFTAGGLKVSVPIQHSRAKTIFDDPMFWVTVLLSGGIVLVGIVFARQESVYFAIDIPDFPPVARTRIPLSPDVILSIFGKVNETYRWQNTPLTPSEVKNGFRDIFFQGKPIYITDYNVDYLLEEMEKKGIIKESLGYYGLATWEQKSGHTIEYLAIMRRLRDICVNNAIPFTGIGEAEDADSIITVVGQQMSLHFYERGTDISKLLSRVIPTINRGIAIILFKNNSDKEHFMSVINSSPTVGPLIVKMESDSSSLLLHTAEELEKMLIEFKSM